MTPSEEQRHAHAIRMTPRDEQKLEETLAQIRARRPQLELRVVPLAKGRPANLRSTKAELQAELDAAHAELEGAKQALANVVEEHDVIRSELEGELEDLREELARYEGFRVIEDEGDLGAEIWEALRAEGLVSGTLAAATTDEAAIALRIARHVLRTVEDATQVDADG